MIKEKETVFVGGPIQYAIDDGGIFDAKLKSFIQKALVQLDKYGFKTLSAHRYESYGEMDVTNMQKEVCLRDFQWMQQCDCFIAMIPGAPDGTPVRTDGTSVELGWASSMQKKIVIVHSEGVTYSHLVEGLHAIADVTFLSIEEFSKPEFSLSVFVKEILSKAENNQLHAKSGMK